MGSISTLKLPSFAYDIERVRPTDRTKADRLIIRFSGDYSDVGKHTIDKLCDINEKLVASGRVLNPDYTLDVLPENCPNLIRVKTHCAYWEGRFRSLGNRIDFEWELIICSEDNE